MPLAGEYFSSHVSLTERTGKNQVYLALSARPTGSHATAKQPNNTIPSRVVGDRVLAPTKSSQGKECHVPAVVASNPFPRKKAKAKAKAKAKKRVKKKARAAGASPPRARAR